MNVDTKPDMKYIGASDGAPFGFQMEEDDCAAYWKRLQPMFDMFGAKVIPDTNGVYLEFNEQSRTIWHKDGITVIYDDKLPISAKYFALSHELGHIALNHVERYRDTKGMYHIMEHEAETFAIGILNIIAKQEGLRL